MKIDQKQFEQLWDFCNRNGDDYISGNELGECAHEAADFVGMTDSTQQFLYDFGVKYWDIVDINNDGALEFDEFRFTLAAFAATDAGVMLTAYDINDDEIIDGVELHGLFERIHEIVLQTGHNLDFFEKTWVNSQGWRNRPI